MKTRTLIIIPTVLFLAIFGIILFVFSVEGGEEEIAELKSDSTLKEQISDTQDELFLRCEGSVNLLAHNYRSSTCKPSAHFSFDFNSRNSFTSPTMMFAIFSISFSSMSFICLIKSSRIFSSGIGSLSSELMGVMMNRSSPSSLESYHTRENWLS